MEMQPLLAELVVKDITGEDLSLAEEERVKAWTDENPAHARMLDHLRNAQWRMREWQTYKEVDKQAVWEQMQTRARTTGQPPLPPLNQPDWSRGPSSGWRTPGKGRTIKIWAFMAALILYHNH